MGKMDANLMRTSGLQPAAKERSDVAELLFDIVMRDRRPRRDAPGDGDLLAVVR